ncbi:MAG: hypothetical protein WC450_08895 [Candidatus Omnitrophota bacterium]|jgi:hypothetical protein
MGTFGGKPLLYPPSSIINAFSDGGVGDIALNSAGISDVNGKQYASGALTADTYKEILAVSGAGFVSFVAIKHVNATNRSVGIKIVVDGVTIFDAATTASAAATYGLVALGMQAQQYTWCEDTPIPFYSSLSVSIKSSLTETDCIIGIISHCVVGSGFGISPLLAPVTSIVNYYSAGGVQTPLTMIGHTHMLGKSILSGALTADTYKAILTVTGSGVIGLCVAAAMDTTSRTVGLKLQIGSGTPFDAVSSAITVGGKGIVAIGTQKDYAGADHVTIAPSFYYTYTDGFILSVKTSVAAETDKIRAIVNYRPS